MPQPRVELFGSAGCSCEPQPKRPKQERKKRPGQLVPPSNRCQSAASKPASYNSNSSRDTNAASERSAGAATGPTWQERKEKQHMAWKGAINGMHNAYVDAVPVVTLFHHEEQVAILGMIQERVDNVWKYHVPCCHSADEGSLDFDKSSVVCVGTRKVKYMGISCSGELSIPTWACSTCNETFTVSPHIVGCFPSTPTDPHLWYDIRLLQMYKDLGIMQGLSATGVCSVAHCISMHVVLISFLLVHCMYLHNHREPTSAC